MLAATGINVVWFIKNEQNYALEGARNGSAGGCYVINALLTC
jgi:hypothetical protein